METRLKSSCFAILATLLIGACSHGDAPSSGAQQASETNPPTHANHSSADKVIIATEANFFPLRHRDGANVAGYQAELLREMAKHSHLDLEFVITPYARQLELLPKADYTATLGTFDATAENKQLADFTDPITTMHYVIHIKSDEDGVGTVADLKGKKISIDGYYAKNPEFIHLIEKLTGSPDNIIIADTQFLSWSDMVKNRADGVFGENLVLDYTHLTHGKKMGLHVKTIKLDLPENERSLLVKKGNDALVQRLNHGLAQMKKDGSYQALYQKWFAQISN